MSWHAIAVRILLAAALLPAAAATEPRPAVSPPRIEAAFLRNFAHYVSWPANAFADERSPWRVCIIGDDPFGDILDETLRGRQEQGRAFLIVRGDAAASVRSCHLVYVAHSSVEQRRKVLAEAANRPVLTIGATESFLDEGGIIRFQVSDRVNFAIDLDHAGSASLKVPTKMLEVAHEVVEHGSVRKRR